MYNNISNFDKKNFFIDNQALMYQNNQDDRILGGFLGPFILGGITGGLVAPYFNNSNSGYYVQPPYYTNNYYYPPYYGPYYY